MTWGICWSNAIWASSKPTESASPGGFSCVGHDGKPCSRRKFPQWFFISVGRNVNFLKPFSIQLSPIFAWLSPPLHPIHTVFQLRWPTCYSVSCLGFNVCSSTYLKCFLPTLPSLMCCPYLSLLAPVKSFTFFSLQAEISTFYFVFLLQGCATQATHLNHLGTSKTSWCLGQIPKIFTYLI